MPTHTYMCSYIFLSLSSDSNSRRANKQSLKGIVTSHGGFFPLPLTNAGSVVLGKSRRTFACEAANGVDTQELAVVLLSCTLIKICRKTQEGHCGQAGFHRYPRKQL